MERSRFYRDAQETYRPALPSPSEVITMQKTTEKIRENKEQGD